MTTNIQPKKFENLETTTISFDDGIGSRNRRHKNFIFATAESGEQIIFEFPGKDVQGVLRILKEEYDKNGKWSKSIWDIELAPGVEGFTLSQDFGTGEWFSETTWEAVRENIRKKIGSSVTDEAIDRMIKYYFKDSASIFDYKETVLAPCNKTILELLESQEQVVATRTQVEEINKDIDTYREIIQNEIELRELKEQAQVGKVELGTLKKAAQERKMGDLSDLKRLVMQDNIDKEQ